MIGSAYINKVFLFVAGFILVPGLVFGQAHMVTYKGHKFDVFSADYPKDKIRMFWENDQKEKLRSFDNLKKYVESAGHKLVFATNAGMFTEHNDPCGLYIENGKQLKRINLSQKGSGNFNLQPNGVFLLTATEGKVITSKEFSAFKNKALYATQSGPMLVVNGVINNNFTNGSQNVYVRSGVGISKDGRVVFAISDEEVNFYDFAALFRDNLNCNNALYLDGAISMMYLPQLKRMDAGGDFGAMIGVIK